MAKAKTKGKQKQDTQPAVQPVIQPNIEPNANVVKEPEMPPEPQKESTKEVVDDGGLMEIPGAMLDDGWPTPVKVNQDAWINNSPYTAPAKANQDPWTSNAPSTTPAKANQDPWMTNAPSADGYSNVNRAQATKGATAHVPKVKGGATHKAASNTGGNKGGWGQDNNTWGGGGDDGWGNNGGHNGWGGGGGGGGEWEEWEQQEEEDEDEEDEEDDGYGWGAQTQNGAWGIRTPSAAPQTSWRGWSEEAKRLSKATPPAPTGHGGANRTVPTLQQQSQMQALSSLLSQPQTQNGYAQQQHKQRQPANPYPPQSTLHSLGGNVYPVYPAVASAKPPPAQSLRHTGKEEAYSKKERDRTQQNRNFGKHQRSHSENFDTGGWGMQDTGVSDNFGWGTIPEEDEEYEDGRRVHFSPRRDTLDVWGDISPKPPAPSIWGSELSRVSATPRPPDKPVDMSYTMPSKTLAHAYNGTTTPLNTGIPRNKINEYTNVQFSESKGAALGNVQQALFGRTRKAKDRIHWMFPSGKDERVESLLTWIQSVSYSLGSYGLHRFLQSRERGALLTNADFRLPGKPGEPAFDWLTFDQLQETRDKILQESVAFYDPAKEVVVFVFLPSKSGNSVAMWRRRINVPNNMRLMLQGEISLALAGLRQDKDYIVHVDEYPMRPAGARRASVPAYPDYSAYPIMVDEGGVGVPTKKKKKRKWWQFFKITW